MPADEVTHAPPAGVAALPEPVQEFLATKPDSGSPDDPVALRRAAIHRGSDELFHRFSAPVEPVPTQEHRVPAAGHPDGLRVRVYRPELAGPLPVHVFLHGGGWWLGSIDELVNDALCHQRAREAGCVVVAVEYRLAPENPFPAPFDDGLAAVRWAHDHATELGGDAAVLSVGGISAGATLAAAIALACRTDGPPLVGQVLEVPPLDLTLQTMRCSGVADDFGITRAEMELCRSLYVPDGVDLHDPRVSPLLALDLVGSPRTTVLAAEFDPLYLDGRRFVARLRGCGVPARYAIHAGAVHGSLSLTASWSGARRWQQEVIQALRATHRTPAALSR